MTTRKLFKSRWRRAASAKKSLRAFARELAARGDEAAQTWLENKGLERKATP